MDNLIGLKSFIAVAEDGGFVGAGRKLGISSSAVGKNVAKLEAELGLRLFQRTTRRVGLTAEGHVLLQHCRPLVDQMTNLRAMMESYSANPKGLLRISLPHICYRFLMPILPDFHSLYPDIVIDLDFDERPIDMIGDAYDAIIRSGVQTDSSFLCRTLGSFNIILCAAPSYLARKGTPRSIADLRTHSAIQFRYSSTGKLKPWALAGDIISDMATTLICNNMEAVRGAVLGGLGVAYVPDFLVGDALEDGRLVSLLDDHRAPSGEFTIIWPSNELLAPRVRVFVDFVARHLMPEACS